MSVRAGRHKENMETNVKTNSQICEHSLQSRCLRIDLVKTIEHGSQTEPNGGHKTRHMMTKRAPPNKSRNEAEQRNPGNPKTTAGGWVGVGRG